MKKKPLAKGSFSIIIPVKAYNAYCRESLGACVRLYPGQEILFSPDAPTKVPFKGVKVVPSGPKGPSFKRDLCAAKAKGKYLAFLDDDAFPEPGWLEAAAAVFEGRDVAGVGGPAVTPEEDGLRRWASGLVYQSAFVGGPYAFRYVPRPARDVDDYPTCNLLVRRDVFRAIGGFGNEYWPGEDTVACLKITHRLKKRIVYDPRVLVRHHRRDLYAGHLRQVNAYARHRGHFVKRFPETSARLSYFLPTLFLAGVALGWLPGLWWAPWGTAWKAGLALYALLAGIEALRLQAQAPSRHRGFRLWWFTASGLAVTHLSYGFNFVIGLLSKDLARR